MFMKIFKFVGLKIIAYASVINIIKNNCVDSKKIAIKYYV